MTDEEQYAVWFGSSLLQASGETIQAAMLDQMAADSIQSGGLTVALTNAQQSDHRHGDFGMEIAGAALVAVVVEVGKQVWAAYLKKFSEEVGGGMAKATSEQVKSLARSMWQGPGKADAQQQVEDIVRRLATAERLDGVEVDRLVAAIRTNLAEQLAGS